MPGISPLYDVHHHPPTILGAETCSLQRLQLAPSPRARGGARRDRTDDLLRARQALSHLSYGPDNLCDARVVGLGGLEPPASPLSGVRSNQLSYRPVFGTRALAINAVCQTTCVGTCVRVSDVSRKGGDPAAGSPTATLLRLHPSHRPHRGKRPPCG